MICVMAPLVQVEALLTVAHDTAPVKKLAVTNVPVVIDTVHVPVPEHPAPDQPVNVEPGAAVAVRTTLVP